MTARYLPSDLSVTDSEFLARHTYTSRVSVSVIDRRLMYGLSFCPVVLDRPIGLFLSDTVTTEGRWCVMRRRRWVRLRNQQPVRPLSRASAGTLRQTNRGGTSAFPALGVVAVLHRHPDDGRVDLRRLRSADERIHRRHHRLQHRSFEMFEKSAR